MQDKVELYVNNKVVSNFISYTIDADLYTPADAFKLQLANPGISITPGLPCMLKINGSTELMGIIDKVEKSVDKKGTSLSVEGRDYMGVLVDSYCETSPSVANKKIGAIADILLANLRANNPQFPNFLQIKYQENVVGKYKTKKEKSSSTSLLYGSEEAHKIAKIEPGTTIFEALKNLSMSRGLLFWAEPDGRMVIGRPMAKGKPEFTLTLKKSGIGNNVIKSQKCDDISKQYSKVTVIGQRQGQDSDGETLAGAQKVNPAKGTKEDDTFPFYKPFVTVNSNDAYTQSQYARLIMEKQRRESRKLTYTVDRHHQLQNGTAKNWKFNTFCEVVDEAQGINDNFLIYGRTFELSRQDGPTTTIHLGPSGLISEE